MSKWDFQDVAIDRIRAAIRSGKKRILVVQPTGTGKGTIASRIAKMVSDKGNQSLFLVHVGEIVENIAGRMVQGGLSPSIIMPEHSFFETDTYCGTVQSFHSRLRRKRIELPDIKVIQFDEAHRYNPNYGMYFDIGKAYPNATIIGYTATPIRADGAGLGDFFDCIIQAIDYTEAIESGVLVPPKYYCPYVPDLSEAKLKGADYDDEYLSFVMDNVGLTGDIVEHYARHAGHIQSIVYATNRKHARHLEQAFSAAGFASGYVDGTTPTDERREIIKGVYDQSIQVLVNVGVVTEGFDAPSVGCIVLARPTKTIRYHLQTIGRGLRSTEGKSECLVLDHAGNVLRLGFVEEYNQWNLETSKKVRVKPKPKVREVKEGILFTCENCGQEFHSQRKCPTCGLMLPSSSEKEDIPVLEGDLNQLDKSGFKIPKVATPIEKQTWFAMLLFYANQRGYKSSWVTLKYKDKFKEYPARSHGIKPELPTEEVLAWIRKNNQRHFMIKKHYSNKGRR